ncbi:MAG: alpha/beta hydrolase [Armatimonadota bacterium]|nr:alpha/beta hydrolase [Armatimonadota bacterium]MDR7539124.1 alpha/beta hydrolase [Armatimonadota bacterium]
MLIVPGAGLAAVLVLLVAVGAPPARAHTPIRFPTDDGMAIAGYEIGRGRTAVILSPMYATDQRIWFPLAEELARRGYTAITYDYRGIGRSGGRFVIAQTYRDALAAVAYATRRGPRPVVLIGASMGGTVSLKAAALRPVAGVVVIASGMRFRGLDVRPHLPTLRTPKLFIAGTGDQPFADSVRTMHMRTPPPKALRLYPTGAHGVHLFATPQGPAIRAEILTFVRTYAD